MMMGTYQTLARIGLVTGLGLALTAAGCTGSAKGPARGEQPPFQQSGFFDPARAGAGAPGQAAATQARPGAPPIPGSPAGGFDPARSAPR
jgi:hypothetical protein